ncbi:hypothetical protein [Paraburkholderia caribensis]|uniref:hypothetical protein n=1 Tax=Paraburkholderia caribensis TaxID=75105 RepID=UPI0020913930|nr:hypothetical protein [Paraburkholderia caribensis]MCO4879028.1 hypothetical protein [Paraburkholderia caribensis]
MDFVADADAQAVQILASLGYKPKPRDTPLDRFATLYTRIERTIPPLPYEVRLSDEIRQNPKYKTHVKALGEIVSRLRNGESVRPYLSTLAVRPAFQDTLLLTWGIHHLHLNTIDTLDKRGFVARKRGASELLLLRIRGQTAYLIDIVSHDEADLFDNPRLLEVVDRNWPELHHHAKGITGEVFTPQKVKALRSNHANFAMHVNGRTIMPTGGVTASGVPIEVYGWYWALHAELRNVEADVRRRYYEFFPHSVSPKQNWRAINVVRLVGIEDAYFVLQDQATLRLSHAVRVAAQK